MSAPCLLAMVSAMPQYHVNSDILHTLSPNVILVIAALCAGHVGHTGTWTPATGALPTLAPSTRSHGHSLVDIALTGLRNHGTLYNCFKYGQNQWHAGAGQWSVAGPGTWPVPGPSPHQTVGHVHLNDRMIKNNSWLKTLIRIDQNITVDIFRIYT